jgi:hypothetical protein
MKVVEMLADTGALEPRQYAASAALLASAARLAALVGRWDEAEYTRLFSADFRDAHPVATIVAKLAEWRAQVGACRDPRPLALEDPRAGTFELACERGLLKVELRVAPWAGGPITSFKILEATGLAPPPALTAAADGVLKLLDRWDERAFRGLFAPTFTAEEMRGGFAEAAGIWGRCRLGAARITGAREAVFALECDRGAPTLRLKVPAGQPAKVVTFHLREPREGACQ